MNRYEQRERRCKKLNEIMEWARQQTNPDTDEGKFSFNTPKQCPHWADMCSHLGLLQEIGFVRLIAKGKPNTWWIKPDGAITPDDIEQMYKRRRKP